MVPAVALAANGSVGNVSESAPTLNAGAADSCLSVTAKGEAVSVKTAAKFSVDSATGQVTFKVGTPKGAYMVQFKIASPAKAGYKANGHTATGTFKIV